MPGWQDILGVLRQALTAALVGMASVPPRSLLCLAAGCCVLCASAALSEKEMREVEKKFKDEVRPLSLCESLPPDSLATFDPLLTTLTLSFP